MVSSRIQVPPWTWHELCCFQKHLGFLFVSYRVTIASPICLCSSMRFFSRAHSSPVVYLPGAHLRWVNTCLSPPALITLFPSDVCQHHPETSDSSDNFSIGCGIIRQWVRWSGGVIIWVCFPEKGTERLCRQKSSRADVLAHCRLRSLSWHGNQHLRWSSEAFRCKGTQGWSLLCGEKASSDGQCWVWFYADRWCHGAMFSFLL